MKIVFVSNYLNHHQIPFCEAMIKKCDEFYFIATENQHFQGYQTKAEAPYVIHYFLDEEKENAEALICEADAVIFGSCPNELIAMRMQEDKLSFLYSERFFKKGTWRRFIPSTRKKVMERIGKYKNKNLYILCASAYLPYDLSLIKFPTEKCFKWGYFPEIEQYPSADDLINTKETASILWAGRLISWKHPEASIYVAKRLKHDGYKFNLNIIGSGELEYKLQKKICSEGLEECVHMRGSMKPRVVRTYMEKSQIFMFTSDRNEGWGAVLNESMNSGCTVVASRSIGSVPFLVNNGENGFVYKCESKNELYKTTKYLLDNPEIFLKIGKNSIHTVQETWNANMAANHFYHLVENFRGGQFHWLPDSGPCSRVVIIKK